MSDNVNALANLPNGDLVAAGAFTTAGGVAAKAIARWNPGTGSWSAMGTNVGTQPGITSLVTLPGGDLAVGGVFNAICGVAANSVARWNAGTGAWAPIGGGMDYQVADLVPLPGGDLLAGGYFTQADGKPANYVARWNQAVGAWSAIGGGADGWVESVAPMPNGDIVVGCQYWNVSRWSQSESQWTQTGKGLGNGPGTSIQAMVALPSGDVVAGGGFVYAGGERANGIARWNASTETWSTLGTGLTLTATAPGVALSLAVLPDGDVVAGGDFIKAGATSANYIARWDEPSGTWSTFGAGMGGNSYPVVRALAALPSGDFYAGGQFNLAGGVTADGVAKWTAATQAWSPLGSGVNSVVNALTLLPNGDLVAGGSFTVAGGVNAEHVARWSPLSQSWSVAGSGLYGGSVIALATLPDGSVVAGGGFSGTPGGTPAKHLARWAPTGTGDWTEFGGGTNEYVSCIRPLSNGDLVIGGIFALAGSTSANRIAYWSASGGAWSAQGSGIGGTGPIVVNSIVVRDTGEIVAGGLFFTAGDSLAAAFARYGCPPAPPLCYPDCDLSGGLDIDDFICFQTLYAVSDPKADCDQSGSLDIDDFICFQTAYAIGC